MRAIVAIRIIAMLLALTRTVAAQTSAGIAPGETWTGPQWNNWSTTKQDYLGNPATLPSLTLSPGRTSATPVALTIQPPTGTTSRRAALTLGGWQLLQDTAANGTQDLAIYQGATGFLPIRIDSLGRTNLFWEHNGRSNDSNAYAPIGWALYAGAHAGVTTPSTGTMVTMNIETDIADTADTGNGTLSEYSPFYKIIVARRDRVQKAWNIWGEDSIVADKPATGGTTKPTWFVGQSIRVHAFNDMTALSASNAGSYGVSIVARPLAPGEFNEHGDRAGDRTLPLLAMLQLSGCSGPDNTTAPCAKGATAWGDAAMYGLRIGGGGGSVYVPYDAHSRFSIGAEINDWRRVGLHITAPLAAGQGNPLVIDPQAGAALIGNTAGTTSSASLVIGPQVVNGPALNLRNLPPCGTPSLRSGDLCIGSGNPISVTP